MSPTIQVENLKKAYHSVIAVDGISFAVPAGSVTALLGGNGAGKTTTIAMLLGLIKPTSGSVIVLGHDMVHNRFGALERMNFSSPYTDLPGRLTVRQNLMVFGNLYSVKDLKNRIEQLAADLQLTSLLDRPTGELSAGQKTRATVAKSLLNKPELLLLDEPTASLDPDTADWLRSYLMDYRKTCNATILMASHNMLEVERMADHVIMMRTGSIVHQGSPAEMLNAYNRATLEDVFLDIARNRKVDS